MGVGEETGTPFKDISLTEGVLSDYVTFCINSLALSKLKGNSFCSLPVLNLCFICIIAFYDIKSLERERIL